MNLNKPPVVFNLLQSTVRGGLEAMFIEYTELLQNLGYHVICFVPTNFQYIDELNKLSATIETIDIKGHYDLLAAVRFQKSCKLYHPEFIFSHNGRTNSMVNLWSLFLKKSNQQITTIAVSHGCIKRMKPFNSVIVVSDYLGKRLHDSGYKGTVFHLPNFLSFNEREVSKHSFKKHTHNLEHKSQNNSHDETNSLKNIVSSNTLVGHPKVVLGTLSRLSPEKNINFVIRALAFIKQKHPELNIQLNIAGDGECKTELVNLVQDLQLTDSVHFLGWIKNKSEFFNKIDFLVFPSTYEPFGIIILESFYHMTPVIASNAYGPAEIITHKQNGMLFEVDNIDDFSKQLMTLIHKPPLSKQLTNNALDALENKYSKQYAQKELGNFLASL